MSKLSIKYLPFSPGIPWSLRKGKYVIPEVPYQLLNSKLKNKKITALAFGGLFESFYSLCVFEAINRKMPGHKMYWAGNEMFQTLVHRQGLASISPDNLGKDLVDRFPVPVFFDKEDGAYFNLLNNYRKVYTYDRRLDYHNSKSAIKQITSNILIPWDERFLPKFRNYHTCPTELKQMLAARYIDIDKPFVLIIPGKSKYSNINFDCLNWSHIEFNSLVAALNSSRITPIVIQERGIYIQGAKTIPANLDFLMFLLLRAKAIVSSDIDFQLISLLSDRKLISLKLSNEFGLRKNHKYLEAQNRIFLKDKIDPIEVWDFILN